MLDEYVLLITGCLGLLTTAILLFYGGSNRIVNFYLIYMLLYISGFSLLRSSYILGIQDLIDQTTFGYKRLSILMFPTLYLYFKQTIKEPKKWNVNDLLHYIVPVFFFITVQFLDAFGYLSTAITSILYVCYFLCILFYLILSIRLYLISYINNPSHENHLIGRKKSVKNWILFLLGIHALLCTRVLVLVCMDLYHGTLSGFEQGIWLWATIIIAIFVKLLISPEILFGTTILQKRINNDKEKDNDLIVLEIWKLERTTDFKNKQDESLAAKVDKYLIEKILAIEQLVLRGKIFRNSNFDYQMLAREIQVPKSHLTFIFKYHSQLFFPEFKKMLQIMDAEKLINDGYLAGNTIESLSFRVGFSSYNPFYIAFKKHTGLSPNNYIKQ